MMVCPSSLLQEVADLWQVCYPDKDWIAYQMALKYNMMSAIAVNL